MIAIHTLSGAEARARHDALAAILHACVDDGASIGFMAPFTRDEAAQWWEGVFGAVTSGATALLVAEHDGILVGTAQLGLDMPPNGRHRADVKKVMVAPSARRLGVARALMGAVEAEARRHGRFVLVLDTVSGSPADRLYRSLGWIEAGPIPDYARWPDGPLCPTTFFYRRLPDADP